MHVLNGKKLEQGETVVGPDGTRYPPDAWMARRAELGIVEVDDPVRPDDRLFVVTVNEDGSYNTEPRPLVEIKAAKNAEINAARATANTGTFPHDSKAFSCDALSRSGIDGVNGYVALYGVLPPAFPGAWKAADNSYYPIADLGAWKAFYASMVATGAANFAHAQELKTQLAAATTPEAVAAIVW